MPQALTSWGSVADEARGVSRNGLALVGATPTRVITSRHETITNPRMFAPLSE
jgi:hypothetical protein